MFRPKRAKKRTDLEEPCANIVFGKNYMFVIAKRFIVA